MHIRPTLHYGHVLSPWNFEGPWNSSKGHTIHNWSWILCNVKTLCNKWDGLGIFHQWEVYFLMVTGPQALMESVPRITLSLLWLGQHMLWLFIEMGSFFCRYGMSQPPFLLSLYDNYKKLEPYWNVRGLGRNEFSEQEREYMLEKYQFKPQRKPFISLDADSAKILHFNGKFKPWKSVAGAEKVSLCGQRGVECAKLWWEYLGHTSDIILREWWRTSYSHQPQNSCLHEAFSTTFKGRA